MAAAQFTIRGLSKLQNKMANQGFLNKPLAGFFGRIAVMGERTARGKAPRDTGTLAGSFMSESSSTMARIWSPRKYALAVEQGRAPGKMPPPAALLGWVQRHTGTFSIRTRRRLGGTSQAASDRSVAFLIARAIGRRGIKGRFFMKATAAKITGRMPVEMARLVREIRGG